MPSFLPFRDRVGDRDRRGQRREPPADRFGGDFVTTIGRAFRECSRRRQAAIVLLLAGAVLGALGRSGPVILVGLAAAVGVLLARVPRPDADTDDALPSDTELAAVDALRAREEADAYAASGDGHREFERVLRRLQGLVGRDVTVIFGAPDPDWRPIIRLQGVLRGAKDVTDADTGGELLQFAVGDSGSGFYLARTSFARGEAVGHRGDSDELMLVLGDVVLLILETTPA